MSSTYALSYSQYQFTYCSSQLICHSSYASIHTHCACAGYCVCAQINRLRREVEQLKVKVQQQEQELGVS